MGYKRRMPVENKNSLPGGYRRGFAHRDISVFFYGFIVWLIENALANGITKLYFFTREGEFFQALYGEVKKRHPSRDRLPDAEVLEVSRLATFLPSLPRAGLAECRRIWDQYETQSMRAFFKSLTLRQGQVCEYLGRYGIAWEESITRPWEDARVQALFLDKEFLSVLDQERKKKRGLLYQYFTEKGWSRKGQAKVGIVDIGWKGTIQDHLCYLYPNYEIVGFYAGLQKFLSPQPVNGKKFGYINAYRFHKLILMTVTPLEMLCNSPNGSVAAYGERQGHAYAEKKNEGQEDAVFYSYTSPRQKEVVASMAVYSRNAKRREATHSRNAKRREAAHSRNAKRREAAHRCNAKRRELAYNHYAKRREWRREFLDRQAYRAFYRFVAWPDRETAAAYFSLRHNEEYGMGRYLDKRVILPPGKFAKAWLRSRKRGALKGFLRETTWPQGYFVKYRLYPILVIYNMLLLIWGGMDLARVPEKGYEGHMFGKQA